MVREVLSDRLIRYYQVKFDVEKLTDTLSKVILISSDKRMFNYVNTKTVNTISNAMEELAIRYCIEKGIDVKESKLDRDREAQLWRTINNNFNDKQGEINV